MHYIYKLNLIESNSRKAVFFRESCADEWNYIVLHPEQRQTNLKEWDIKHK